MIIAVIKETAVINTAVFDDIETAQEFLHGGVFGGADDIQELPDGFGIGDFYIGGEWEKAPNPPEPPGAGLDPGEFVLGLMGVDGDGDGRAGGLALRGAAMLGAETGALAFVTLAQSLELFDDVTIMEHSGLFAEWPEATGLVCKRGTIVWDGGKLYKALHDIGEAERLLRPSETAQLWGVIGDPAEEWPEWSQWIGVGDAYQTGDKVRSVDYGNPADEVIYRWVSIADNNVWRPGEYGWDKVGVHG